MIITRYYLLTNSMVLYLCHKKYEFVLVQKSMNTLYILMKFCYWL